VPDGQSLEPEAAHHPAGKLAGGHELEPTLMVQQNSVYPSQHGEPQLQLEPAQLHMAA
jgi:hypothetical protein